MEAPSIKTVLVDEQNGVRYEVMAYRPLSREEMVLAVRMFLSQRKRKKPKRGDIITVISIIGFND